MIDATRMVAGTIAVDVAKMMNQANESKLVIGIVQEVMFDPDYFSSKMTQYRSKVDFPARLIDAPANTLLTRVMTEGEYRNTGKLSVAYPMFPSHLQMPIKVGESVFIFKFGFFNYWLSRVPENLSVEDVNFTHADRKHLVTTAPQGTIEESEQSSGAQEKFIGVFNNGGLTEGNESFPSEGPEAFLTMFENSASKGSHTFEAVPRYLKRPGDLVLQGSHNTLISLGQTRGWLKDDPSMKKVSNVHDMSQTPGAGSIDITVGRGRYIPVKPANKKDDGDDPIRTACRTIANERGEDIVEANRMSLVNGVVPNPLEGDPDLEYDAARISVNMKNAPDASFNLVARDEKNIEKYFQKMSTWPNGPTGEAVYPKALFGSSIVSKADHVRIIARYQEEGVNGLLKGVEKINGSIRLIKEGIPNAEDGTGRSMLLLEPDGTILLDGPTVIIGNGHESLAKGNGEGTQIILGHGATEPIVLGNVLKDLLDKHFNDVKTHLDDLKSFCQTVFDTHIHPTGVGPSGPPTTPSVGVQTAIEATKTQIDASIEDLINTLSKFGKTK